MQFSFSSIAMLFAQAADGAAAGDGPSSTVMMMWQLMPFAAIGLLLYFMLIRPQSKEQGRRKEMLAAIKKNDRVLTIGGVFGVVADVQREANEVTIKVDESTNTKLRVQLSSIAQVIDKTPSDASEK